MLLSEEGGKILRDSLREVDFNSQNLKQVLRNNIHYNVIVNQVHNSTLLAIINVLKNKDTVDIGGINISSIKNTLIEAFSLVCSELESDVFNLNRIIKQEQVEENNSKDIVENIHSPVNKRILSYNNNTRLSSINNVNNDYNVMENNNEYSFLNVNRIIPQEVR
jgi:hypothetical protein